MLKGTLYAVPEVTAELSGDGAIIGSLSANISIGGTVTVPNIVETPTYEGDYEITPLAYYDVVLPVKGYKMAEDVTVSKVPYYETSNIFNGKTVYIAEDVNNG